jgi:hypothetical protein
MIKRKTITVTTDGSGDASETIQNCNGLIYQVRYVVDGGNPFATGANITFKEADTELNVLTMAAIGTSSFTRSPRELSCNPANGTVGTNSDPIAVHGDMTIVVNSGGATKIGVFHIWIEE